MKLFVLNQGSPTKKRLMNVLTFTRLSFVGKHLKFITKTFNIMSQGAKTIAIEKNNFAQLLFWTLFSKSVYVWQKKIKHRYIRVNIKKTPRRRSVSGKQLEHIGTIYRGNPQKTTKRENIMSLQILYHRRKFARIIGNDSLPIIYYAMSKSSVSHLGQGSPQPLQTKSHKV